MARTLADRLAQARARTFVGRDPEVSGFELLLDADEPAVVVVHGPAGIGKTSLIRHFAARATARGLACTMIDARDLPPRVEALELRLAGLLTEDVPGPRAVVIIDDYHLLAALDTAVREHLAPRLPHDCLLVLAGRNPPGVGWRGDEGWSPLLHVVALDNLEPAACTRYLDARGVPSEQHADAIAFSHGHPLALALVGEVLLQKGTMSAPDATDVVKGLMGRLLDTIPTAAHRSAIEAAAVVRSLDEGLLAALLDRDDAYELFGWVRSLPYVDDGAYGLVLHDLVRDVVAGDLRWRHPERYRAFHERARERYLQRLDSPDQGLQAVALLDLIFLHPDLRMFLQTSDESAALRIDRATAAESATIEGMIADHEGTESAAIARHWLAVQPEAWWVVRDRDQRIEGTLCLLALDTLTPEESDPAVHAALTELGRHPPLRPGETATLFRFWLARDGYQSVSAAQSIIATQFARHFLSTRGLAVTLIPFAEPQAWEAFCAYADQRRAPDADFTVGGRTYACYGHDWRIVTPAAWLDRMSRQEVAADSSAPPETPSDPRVLVLEKAEFVAAVRQALRDYSRPDRLRDSPLLRCRIVTTRLSGNESATAAVELLRSQLKEAADSLSEVPADRRLHRVLVRAYLAPAPSLERAAEVLELPSSTFRRLLTTAVGRVATLLWHRELDA